MKKSFNSRKAFILYVVSLGFFIIAALYIASVYYDKIKLFAFRIQVLCEGGFELVQSLQVSLKDLLYIILLGVIPLLTVVILTMFIIGLWKKIPRYIAGVLISFVIFTMLFLQGIMQFEEYLVLRYPFGINLIWPGDLYYYAFSIKYILWGIPLILLLFSFLAQLMAGKSFVPGTQATKENDKS